MRRIPALGSPGFKRFRPIVREKNGTLRRLTNNEIAKNPDYGDYSLDQSKLAVEAFYDRMDDVMSPAPLEPMRALKEAITALEEQVKARVTSVENGRKYLSRGRPRSGHAGRRVDLRDHRRVGDFATPSRDLRLLIAVDVVRGFPDRVARRPERYAMPEDKSVAEVKAELDGTLASELSTREVFLYADRRVAMDAHAQGRARPHDGTGDGLQRQRLRRAALGRARGQRGSRDLQAASVRGTARQDGG